MRHPEFDNLHSGKIKDPSRCPTCHTILNGWTNTQNEDPPSEGDVTICCYCAETLEFSEQLKLIKITKEARSQIPTEQLDDALSVVHELISQRNHDA